MCTLCVISFVDKGREIDREKEKCFEEEGED